MKKYTNVLSEEFANKLFNLGKDIVTMKYNGPNLKTWTNYGWDQDIVHDSSAVFCIELPNEMIKQIQNELEQKNIFNSLEHKQLVETKGALVYVWTKNSYIPQHNDGIYTKAVTIYLNKEWEYNQGGLFNWLNPENNEWQTVLPSFNMAMVNDSGYAHGITPVKSNDFRITAQIFLHPII